jgi:hypothetical protein
MPRLPTAPLIAAAALAVALTAGAATATAALPNNGTGTCVAGATTITCTYSGGSSTFTVPAYVSSLDLVVQGGAGGQSLSRFGGTGALVTVTAMAVASNSVLHLTVGQGGQGMVAFSGKGGGGGGSSQVDDTATITVAGGHTIIAGGGGGGGTMTAGGSGSGANGRGERGGGGTLSGTGGRGGDGGVGGTKSASGNEASGADGFGGDGGTGGNSGGSGGDGGPGAGAGGTAGWNGGSDTGGGGGGGYGGGAGGAPTEGGGAGGSIGPAGHTTYAAAPGLGDGSGGRITITYAKESQAIVFTSSAPAPAYGDAATYTPTATGGTSGNPVTFAIAEASSLICHITTGIVYFDHGGNCTIVASQAGDETHLDGETTQAVTISRLAQTTSFTSIAPSPTFGTSATYTPTADGGASGNPVTFAIATASIGICRLESSTVHFDHGGTCTIEAHQAGNGDYETATIATQAITIDQATQTVAFTSTVPTNAIADGATYTPTATSSSGLAVTFASTSSACSVSSGIVHLDRAGTCTISANQAGNSDYLAAPITQQSFDIAAAPVPAAPTAITPLSTSIPLAATSTTTATTITTTFTAPGPGQASQTGTTPTAKDTRGKAIKVCSASKKIKKAGKVRLTCTLTKAARALRKKNSLTVLLTTTFTPTNGTKAISTKTIKLGRK